MRLKKKMNKCKTEGNRECRERVGQQQPKKKHTRMQQFFSLREKGKNHALVYLLQLIQFGDGV